MKLLFILNIVLASGYKGGFLDLFKGKEKEIAQNINVIKKELPHHQMIKELYPHLYGGKTGSKNLPAKNIVKEKRIPEKSLERNLFNSQNAEKKHEAQTKPTYSVTEKSREVKSGKKEGKEIYYRDKIKKARQELEDKIKRLILLYMKTIDFKNKESEKRLNELYVLMTKDETSKEVFNLTPAKKKIDENYQTLLNSFKKLSELLEESPGNSPEKIAPFELYPNKEIKEESSYSVQSPSKKSPKKSSSGKSLKKSSSRKSLKRSLSRKSLKKKLRKKSLKKVSSSKSLGGNKWGPDLKSRIKWWDQQPQNKKKKSNKNRKS